MPFRRILVALDLSSLDEDLIRYTEFLSKIYQPEDIYFVHVAPELTAELDFAVRFQDLPALVKPIDEELTANIRRRIMRYFNEPVLPHIHVEVLEGRPQEQVTHWATVKNVDLVVLGRHRGNLDTTVLIKRLVRHLKGSILVVPEGSEPTIQRIVVPVDFSEDSSRAIFRARQIAERLDDTAICILHIFDIPPGHFQLSRTLAQFERIMEDNARDVLGRFLYQCEAGELLQGAKLLPAEAANPSREIYRYLLESPADLVVLGAKGHSAVERFLVGSVTEGLLDRHEKQAILVTKP